MEDESDDYGGSFEIASDLLESYDNLISVDNVDTMNYEPYIAAEKGADPKTERKGRHSHLFGIVSALKELSEIVIGRRIRRHVKRGGKNQERTHILAIPNEILSLIFRRYFSFLELCMLRTVCSRFSDVASGVLETGFSNTIRDISLTMEDVQKRLVDETKTAKTRNCYSMKNVSLLQTYNILEIIVSELSMLKAVTGDTMCHFFMFAPTAYLLAKSSQILEMLQLHYREEPKNCPPLCTTDQLSNACNHFISNYEHRTLFFDKDNPKFGCKLVDVLDCCLNADSRLSLWCEGIKCCVKGTYILWDFETTKLSGKFSRFLAEFFQSLRIDIQEENTNFVHWKNKEVTTAMVINTVTGGSIVNCLEVLLLNQSDLTRVDHSGKYTLVHRIVPGSWRKRGGLKIEFELECHISEAPNCVVKHLVSGENNDHSEIEVSPKFNWNCTNPMADDNSKDNSI